MPKPIDLTQVSAKEAERRLSHRRRVKASAEAREAAWRALAEVHWDEYVILHEREKAARGIQSRRLPPKPSAVGQDDPDPLAA